MNGDADHSGATLRWAIYWLLIALAAGQMTGRILAVNSVDLNKLQAYRVNAELNKTRGKLTEQGFAGDELQEKLARRRAELEARLQVERPFLSSNDRSRWLTIRALVEDGTYAIDQIVTDPEQHRRWNTIDMVKHDQWGEPHLYSSKPTLLPTLLAGEYWLVRQLTGWTLAEQPFEVVRLMLITINVLPMIVLFVCIAALAERLATSDWARMFVVAVATFGTFLSTFAIVLNNHLIAAVCAGIALYAAVRIWYDERRSGWLFAVAGFFAALTAAIELPALAFLGLLGLSLLWKDPRQTLVWGLPAALIVVVAAVGTNYAAHKTVRPPYWYRAVGKDYRDGNWYNYEYRVGDRAVESYWKRDQKSIERRSIIDRGEASPAWYAVHCLVGHHGIFSLTPVWLFSLIGVFMMSGDRSPTAKRWLATLIAAVTVICLLFYLMQGVENRNYGGMTSGLRWMFWFVPLWLVAMMPAADWIAASRSRRIVALLLLAISALSASYPTWNPWVQPWIANGMNYMGWIEL
jgi:hypothetical protein